MRCGGPRLPYSMFGCCSFLVLIAMMSGGARGDCALRCDAYRPYLCISRTAYSAKIEMRIRTEIKKRFSVCLSDPSNRFFRVNLEDADDTPDLRRPTISVSVIDCDRYGDWKNLRLRHWPPQKSKGCSSDISLLLAVVGGRIIPVFSGEAALFPLQIRNTSRAEEKRSYPVDALKSLFDDVYGRINMPPLTDEPITTVGDGPYHQENHSGNEDMEPNAGWPTWAIIVLIVSVVLSVVAFFIGNFINKRNSPRSLKQAKGIPMAARKRNWGAGFSGGLWAAA
ncbi:hypothetical protein PRIPAC_95828 [Pristionchus pacificus]|uniref:Uncharacterized protein n=1 Tax=Pristionchus pacificus TaxID=54126 RepID=A0A2A6CGU3_PRIPA|nr:hypothetical protein PRIPAC_95828 [Pristionchus pacificus]|eukprot:PDM77445.1 hypothetical protein PRIPAC_33175 [Pristionchus pacificus]